MTDNVLPANPGFEQQELDAAFPVNQIAPASDAAPESGLLSNQPVEEAGAPNDDYQPYNPLFESFSSAMLDQGFQVERLAHARAWLDTLQGEPLENVSIAHGFDVSGYRDVFNEQDQPILTSFLNHASRSGWTQDEVTTAIQWYLSAFSDTGQLHEDVHETLRAERDIEALDRQDRDLARDTLREQWGPEYDANIHLANRHLDSLPASQREFYEGAESDGSLRLNNPKWLDRLAQEARAQVPPILIEAARQHGSERVALENWMSNKGSPYWKGEDAASLQARYRDLVASGDTGEAKPLPSGSRIATEIDQIEHIMQTDKRRYFRDEEMQARYRQLLELRG